MSKVSAIKTPDALPKTTKGPWAPLKRSDGLLGFSPNLAILNVYSNGFEILHRAFPHLRRSFDVSSIHLEKIFNLTKRKRFGLEFIQ